MKESLMFLVLGVLLLSTVSVLAQDARGTEAVEVTRATDCPINDTPCHAQFCGAYKTQNEFRFKVSGVEYSCWDYNTAIKNDDLGSDVFRSRTAGLNCKIRLDDLNRLKEKCGEIKRQVESEVAAQVEALKEKIEEERTQLNTELSNLKANIDACKTDNRGWFARNFGDPYFTEVIGGVKMHVCNPDLAIYKLSDKDYATVTAGIKTDLTQDEKRFKVFYVLNDIVEDNGQFGVKADAYVVNSETGKGEWETDQVLSREIITKKPRDIVPENKELLASKVPVSTQAAPTGEAAPPQKAEGSAFWIWAKKQYYIWKNR